MVNAVRDGRSLRRRWLERFRRQGRGLLRGLWTTGRHVTQRPVTRPYPERHAWSPDRFRGLHRLTAADCVVCNACARVCPVDCITIEAHRGENRRFVLDRFDIDYNRCMFCNLCVEVCPPRCLHMGPRFEYAVRDRSALVFGQSLLTGDSGD